MNESFETVDTCIGFNTAQQIQVRKRKLLKINVVLLLFKQNCTYMPIKYCLFYMLL